MRAALGKLTFYVFLGCVMLVVIIAELVAFVFKGIKPQIRQQLKDTLSFFRVD